MFFFSTPTFNFSCKRHYPEEAYILIDTEAILDCLGESTNTLIERERERSIGDVENFDFCLKSPKVEISKSNIAVCTAHLERNKEREGEGGKLVCYAFLVGESILEMFDEKYRRRVGYGIARSSAFPLPLPSSRLLSLSPSPSSHSNRTLSNFPLPLLPSLHFLACFAYFTSPPVQALPPDNFFIR